MEIRIIETGYFYADGGAMFGAIPKKSWQRRYPSDQENGCILAMKSLLIKTDEGRIILVDSGAGSKHLKQLSYYRFFDLKDLNQELERYGVNPGDITDVVLTHLHFDHCGYITQKDNTNSYSVTYPNARHWISQSQWENFLNPNPLEKNSYFREDIREVDSCGLLSLVFTDMELCPGVRLCLYEGHTPGQIVPYIEVKGRTFVFSGDVIPLMCHISPDWISAYDIEPLTSYREKIRMLEEAVAKNQTIIFCHDAYTSCATVKKINSFFVRDIVIPL